MTDFWHGYLAVEDLALTSDQRAAIVSAFRALGPTRQETDWPPFLNQLRVNIDSSKAIFEARFNQAHLTTENVVQFLADAAGANPANITPVVTQTARGPLLTLSAGGTPQMRMLLFAGVNATWEESRQQVLAYLAANPDEWNYESVAVPA